MNKYYIEHKIKTLSKLWDEPFEFKGFTFSQWDFSFAEGAMGDAWIASKTIEASDPTAAINIFRKDLFPIADRIAFISQCYTYVELESFLIYKEENNPEKAFFLWYAKERGGVSLHFGDDEKESLTKLDGFDKNHVFEYLREATNSSTYNTRLAMLMTAMEAIAGEKESKDKKSTDRDFIKDQILKDEGLYQKIYKYGEGIRHLLSHGSDVKINTNEINYTNQIYAKIREFFNSKFGTRIDGGVVNPPRTPWGNYEVTRGWFKPAEEVPKIDLKWASEAFKQDWLTSNQITRDKIEYLPEQPHGY